MNKLHDEITRAFEDAAREAEITEPGRYYRHAIAIAAAIRELARTRLPEIAALREGEWQPIETAPHDLGTSVIVAVRHAETFDWIIGEADWILDDVSEDGGEWWWSNTHGEYHADSIVNRHGRPEFWQPLPAPPSPANSEERSS